MLGKVKTLGTVVILFGLVAFAMGAVFVQQGFAKESWLVDAMVAEEIEMPGQEGVIVDNAQLAEEAGDVVREHRRSLAPTYGELLGGERYDPTNTTQLSYSQAMNIENYLYLAVTAFGVFLVVKVVGAFMMLMGAALAVVGWTLRKTVS